ncbi:MAG: butyrate kinase [Clostridia bacterium]|nr:butyrate kinase [Clostridia bacterium]
MKILVINPGSTSTKIALYEDKNELFNKSITHSADEVSKYDTVYSQFDMRKNLILKALEDNNYSVDDLDCVIGRGGLFPPLKTGGYIVNEKMVNMVKENKIPEHASNLGCVIADSIAKPLGIPAYIYDAVSANDFPPIAKITGMPEIERKSFCHVLNSRAMAIKYAKSIKKDYSELNILVAHLGGGITASVHKKGKLVDSLSDDNGAFSPERAGSLPILEIIDMCYSGNYTHKVMKKKMRGNGGLVAHLGTSDCREIEKMIEDGDKKAALVYEAQAYQIAKCVGLLYPVLMGDIDAIILTGGIAYSDLLIENVKKYISHMGNIIVLPGEHEMQAMAEGATRILKGEEEYYTM